LVFHECGLFNSIRCVTSCGPTADPNGLRKRRTNEEINILLKERNIVRYIRAQRLAWLGHLERMHEERTTKKITC
jgi:hypothetical protein